MLSKLATNWIPSFSNEQEELLAPIEDVRELRGDEAAQAAMVNADNS
jgi:hypothetical protein